jgi:hypothetical protein
MNNLKSQQDENVMCIYLTIALKCDELQDVYCVGMRDPLGSVCGAAVVAVALAIDTY